MQKCDYLIVGAGLYGSIFACEANKKGYKCIVVDQRDHIGGNCYTENINQIEIHKYGAHIFHTNKKDIWEYINQFGEFYPFRNEPVAIVGDKTYNLPFNMNTFSKLFNVIYPDELINIINQEKEIYSDIKPRNLEEQAIKTVGETIYNTFIKEYTEKQWGKKCTELSPEIIKRIPIRLTYNNNYFDDYYQGVPLKGYTELIKNILNNISVILNTTYKEVKDQIKADKVIYTGMIDEYYDYKYGELEYRSLKFIDIEKEVSNYQGNAVFNYPSKKVSYIRSIEHKHFVPTCTISTIISYEYSVKHKKGMIPFYPVKTKENEIKYQKYCKLKNNNVYFKGRLGSFKYYDMDDTIENALELVKELL